MISFITISLQEDVPCQQYLYARSAFLSALVPNTEDAKTVQSIKETYFSTSLVVGVHLRTHDDVQDWEVVPPFDRQSSNARKFGDGAGVEDFDRIMTSISEKFTSKTTGKRAVKFYIASNSDEVKQYFANKYEDSLSLRGIFM
jgi:hypothetical protein